MFGNFSSFKTTFPGQVSIPNSFVALFIFYILSYLLLKTMGCLSECLMSSASIQKLFCGICSAFKCSFNEFVGEKVVSPSDSSTILGPHHPHHTDELFCRAAIETQGITNGPMDTLREGGEKVESSMMYIHYLV